MPLMLAAALALTSCAYDADGHYGTRWMLSQWEKAKHDGSLECVDAYIKHYDRNAMTGQVFCVLQPKWATCTCDVPSNGTEREQVTFSTCVGMKR